MGMNYDSWKLMSPEEDFIYKQKLSGRQHVCDCENCCEPLFTDDEAIKDNVDDLLFCSQECFEEYNAENRMKHIHYLKRSDV